MISFTPIYRSLFINLIILILLTSNSIQNPQKITSASKNQSSLESKSGHNKDKLTSMFYHIENTRKCGDNLQSFDTNFKELWLSKFQTQIEKTFSLANSLNHLISNKDINQNNDQNSKMSDVHIIESNLLPALSYFLFTQSASSSNQINNAATFDQKLNFDLKEKQAQEKSLKFYDPYLIGFGVLLFYNIENAPIEFKDLKNSGDSSKKIIKCFYLYTKSNSSDEIDANNLIRNKACLALDSDSKDNPRNSPNPNFSFHSTENLSANSKTDEFYKNCNKWYDNLENAYDKALIKLQNSNETKYSKGPPLNYRKFLRKLLQNKDFSESLWCGPYFECTNPAKQETNDWILIYSLPLFDEHKKLKGAVSIKLKLTNMNVNQCVDGDPIFANTHKCKENSECVYHPINKFKLGSYSCKCKGGYINSNGNFSSYDGSTLENQYWLMKSVQNRSYIQSFNCLPCLGAECCHIDPHLIDSNLYSTIDSEMVKEYQNQLNIFWHCRKYNFSMRFSILFVQIIFIIITIFLSIVVFYSRQNKVIKHSMWILLELMLFGAFLLYFTLVIQYFEPTANTCIAIPWFRELGFTIVYGILNLRLYKMLIEFQSRKAHCVRLKDKDILRILFVLTTCVIGYLIAWTLGDLDYASEGFSLTTNTSLKGYIQYPICKIKWWDYFIEIGEFIFICVGFYLLYCTRTAPSEYNERKFIAFVIYFEGFVSTFLHIIKHSIHNSIHPDTIYLLYFIRCHTTVTMMLFFIFITKLCILFRPNSDDNYRSARLQIEGGVLNHDTIKQGAHGEFAVEDLNLIDMEPEEIRSELKRLYTQIHMFKSKSVKVNNPHIMKKKKENKRVRRLSNAFAKSTVNTESVVKTPEESICSNDITTNHGVNIEEKFNNLGNYLFQQQNSNSNATSHVQDDAKSIGSRLNETTDSKQINLTSSNDTSTQMTPKVQFKKS